MATHTFLIPRGLDIDALISSNPPAITNFQREKAFYIVDAISQIPARNKDVGDDGGYVPLYSRLLRKKIGNRYYEYLKWLMDCGVLECNGRFSVVESISRKYRFTEPYNAPLVRQPIDISQWLVRKVGTSAPTGGGVVGGFTEWNCPIEMPCTSPVTAKLPASSHTLTQDEQQAYNEWMRRVYPNVYRWYDEGGLQVDSSLASHYNEALWRYRMDGFMPIERRWNGKRGAWLPKEPTHQQRANSYNLVDMERRAYNAHFDPNVMRLHSTITSMNKDFRPTITWRGHPLVTVDISNSQPYLLAALLNPDFWANDGKVRSTVTLNDLPYHNNYTSLYPTADIITVCNFIEQNQPADVKLFKEIVTSGKFYERLMKLLPTKGGKVHTRDEMKRLMFMVLFTPNEAITQGWAKAKRDFAALFPHVNKLIRLIQEASSANLPCLLQRLESYLVFNHVLPRIGSEMPDVPVFTIHDGIVTLQGYEPTVARILREELHYATGNMPSYKYDYWNAGELAHDLHWNEALYDEWQGYMQDVVPRWYDMLW